jgi:hypothetical protein
MTESELIECNYITRCSKEASDEKTKCRCSIEQIYCTIDAKFCKDKLQISKVDKNKDKCRCGCTCNPNRCNNTISKDLKISKTLEQLYIDKKLSVKDKLKKNFVTNSENLESLIELLKSYKKKSIQLEEEVSDYLIIFNNIY